MWKILNGCENDEKVNQHIALILIMHVVLIFSHLGSRTWGRAPSPGRDLAAALGPEPGSWDHKYGRKKYKIHQKWTLQQFVLTPSHYCHMYFILCSYLFHEIDRIILVLVDFLQITTPLANLPFINRMEGEGRARKRRNKLRKKTKTNARVRGDKREGENWQLKAQHANTMWKVAVLQRENMWTGGGVEGKKVKRGRKVDRWIDGRCASGGWKHKSVDRWKVKGWKDERPKHDRWEGRKAKAEGKH